MKIVVTGGAGFIGSHLVDAFIDRGHAVWIVDNFSTGRQENVNPRATLVEIDIRDVALREVLRDIGPDLISHQAAQIDVRASVNDPILDAEVNILGSINLLEGARSAKIGRIVFASTGGAIYGEQDYFPADELHPLRPCSPYGIGKLAVEKYLDYYRIEYGLQAIVLRYANVYGPRQNPHGEAGVVAIFCEKMHRGEHPVINGDGLQTRDYVHVRDVVAANLAVLDVAGSDTFNVGTGIESTVTDVFRHLNRANGGRSPEVHGPAKPGEQRRSVVATAKLTGRTGWRPVVALEAGLEETFASFRPGQGK